MPTRKERTGGHRIAIVRVQVVRESLLSYQDEAVKGPEDAAGLLSRYIGPADREHFVMVGLDTKNQPTVLHTVAMGTLNACLVHPREVFKVALLHNCNAIIVGHNHPSGDPEPSLEDVAITQRLAEAGSILGVEVMDSLVIGDGRHVSLRERGVISPKG